jgi:hypothetical protein
MDAVGRLLLDLTPLDIARRDPVAGLATDRIQLALAVSQRMPS